MTPKELSQLKRWQVEGLYWSAEKCASDLSRGCAGLQGERDNLLYENERLKSLLADWQEFATDVSAADCGGQDWLDELRGRTKAALEQKV